MKKQNLIKTFLFFGLCASAGCKTFSGSDLSDASARGFNWAACNGTEERMEKERLEQRARSKATLALLGEQVPELRLVTEAINAATGPRLTTNQVGEQFYTLTEGGELQLESGKTIE